MLPVAKRNLDRHDVVGLTDEFDRSLLLLAHAFGWRRPYYVKENVSRRRRREELDDETRAAIVAGNALDIELYRYGRELFERQLAEHREALSRELRTFVRANWLYGGLVRLRSVARRARSE
jgi:hypothetical protein